MRIFLLALMFSPSWASGQTSLFTCPMKKGRIIVEERGFSASSRNLGAIIEGKRCEVYSCSQGMVKAIDTAENVKRVHIEFENYFFSYNNLRSVTVTTGQTIMAGEKIGEVGRKEQLFLIVSNDKTPIDPESVLKCKVVHRYTE